jgi:hypothetical protein
VSRVYAVEANRINVRVPRDEAGENPRARDKMAVDLMLLQSDKPVEATREYSTNS